MDEIKNFELFYDKIGKFDDQISELLNDFKNEFKEKYWKIIRIHWIKNRHILNMFYKKKIFGKKLIFKFQSKTSLDLNLINLWCKKKFRNLCSTKVLKNSKKGSKTNFCRVSLLKKNLNTFFLVQNISGCVCCTGSFNLNLPIWWDQIEKLFKISKNIKKKSFFLCSFYFNGAAVHFWKKKNWVFLKTHKFFRFVFYLKINILWFNVINLKTQNWNFNKNEREKKNEFFDFQLEK
mmetsp:Transcript_66764/g.164549  ORF Transcript_66764/g.164549 Transcript_66764/m.164549 type:complete len:235 (+) Transcript_66764:3055-3759(+)